MASTSSIFMRTGFCFVKKAQTSPLAEGRSFKYLWFYTTVCYLNCYPLSLCCHIAPCLIAFLDWRISSSIYSKLCRRYRTHPSSPTLIVSSRANRDCIPWTVILQLCQISWKILWLSNLSCQKLKEYVLHSDGITYIFHVGYVIVQSTRHPVLGFLYPF